MHTLNTSPHSNNNNIQPVEFGNIPSIQGDVREYLDRGYCPIPVQYQAKRPLLKDWNQPGLIDANNVGKYFSNGTNIGIVLGDASNGLVDIDIDAEEGAELAYYFLPPTDMKFGRASRRVSHWIYTVQNAENIFVTKDGQGKNIVEVRGNGHQTVFPPSIHPSGERIGFEEEGGIGEPGRSTWSGLERASIQLSLAIVLLRHWKKGSRHSLSLAICGYLATCGRSEADMAKLLSIVAKRANDEEIEDRLNCVRTTFERYRENMAVKGTKELASLFGPSLVAEIDSWFGRTNRPPQSVVPQDTVVTLLPTADLVKLQKAIVSDVDLSNYIAEQVKAELIYCRTDERWFRRHNQVYVPISMTDVEGEVKNRLLQLADLIAPVGLNTTIQRRGLLTTTKIGSIEHLLRSNPNITVDSRGFDRDSLQLGCLDGTILDLEKRATGLGSSSVITRQLGTIFDPMAKCPLWEHFLHRIFNGDADLLAFIRRAVSYTMTGTGSERCLFVLIGNGANGKSTFLKVILKLFRDYGAGTPMHTLMSSRFGNDKNDDLAALPGKRFVQANEAESGQRLAEAKIKMMTGGDSITCRALYGHLFSYDPQFVLWLATNEMPEIHGGADAVWGRLRIIPFDVSIPSHEQDLNLCDQLYEELPGILNWVIDGYHDWKTQKLNPPDKVLRTVSSYREEKDYVAQWITEECIKDPLARATAKELYRTYADWAVGNRLDPLSNSKFVRDLERRGFERSRTSQANKWKGIGLRNNEGMNL